MQLARVVGDVVCTMKDAELANLKLLLVQPIGADGRVSPASVTIARGGRVTITNNHNLSHDMSSDPHPEHNQCPEINQIGFLTTGQSRTSGNFSTARTCGFHEHNLPDNTNLQGRIIIQ